MALTENVAGETVFGSDKQAASGIAVNSATESHIVLVSTNGTEVCIWARNDGKLYGGTRGNMTTPESAGTALW